MGRSIITLIIYYVHKAGATFIKEIKCKGLTLGRDRQVVGSSRRIVFMVRFIYLFSHRLEKVPCVTRSVHAGKIKIPVDANAWH